MDFVREMAGAADEDFDSEFGQMWLVFVQAPTLYLDLA
jgi:hypothetical protein